MQPADTAELVVRLGLREERAAIAPQLARAVGAGRLIVLVRDRVLDVLIPAPGFAQTLYGGPAWRLFAARCALPGRHAGEVDLPAGSLEPALGLALRDIAAIFIAGAPVEDELRKVEQVLPLLGVALRCEQEILVAHSEAAEAKRVASRANALTQALEAARAEAIRLNAELHAAQRRKDEFIAMLAHELRNPLAPLRSALEVIRMAGDDRAAIGQARDIAGRQVDHMVRLVSDLLDVARINRDRIELRKERIALATLVQSAEEANRGFIAAAGHQLEVALPAQAVWLDADPVRLAQVLGNLLNNAAKFTRERGRIRLSAERDGNVVVIRVSDTGIGIPAAMLPRVFDMFTQVESALTRSQGGLGIGLTLVKRLVELHGGTVEVASPGLWQGSEFTVRLPVAAGGKGAEVAGRGTIVAATPARRILLVDDNADAVESMAMLLRTMGHEVRIARDGETALEMAPAFRPELVLLDIGLPAMSGYEVAQRIRAREETRGARLVALTGWGQDQDRQSAREAGFDAHLTKPAELAALETLLASLR